MTRTPRSLAIVVLGLLAAMAGIHAQTGDRAGVMLQTAIQTEMVDGDLGKAIELYREIVARFGDERPVAAQALLHLGHSYEKLGEPEARDVYELLLRDYPDQAEPVAAVRARLSALEVEQTPPPALHTELLWDGSWGPSTGGDVSPDGSLLTYVDVEGLGNLAIRNLATGESRLLTHTADNGGDYYTYNSRISPDGEQVLYSWGRPGLVAGSFTTELRLLPVHGGRTEPRTVWSPADGSEANVQDWFPSGDRVVATVAPARSNNYSIVTVSTVDGQARQVVSVDWGESYPQVRVSPDGRSLAYSRPVSREVLEKDIFIVAVDGSSETAVVQHVADDELVAWSTDGSHLLFNSDRSGQPGLWAQRVDDAEPTGEPRLLIGNLDVGAGLGVTRDGTLHYPVSVSRRRLKIAELDLETGELVSEPINATERFVGTNAAGVFSPDGETLAYLSNREGASTRVIVIRSLTTGQERVLAHEVQNVIVRSWRSVTSWRSDGNHLIVTGRDDRGRRGYFDVDVASGQIRPLTDLPASMPGSVFTPDWTHILYRDPRKDWESIYSYRVADGSVQALPGVFEGGGFRLSPDGQWITTRGGQISQRDGSATEIRVHRIVGGDSDVLLTTDESDPFGAYTWAPDGTALFVAKKEPQAGESMWRLWVVPVDGSDPVATELVYSGGRFSVHPDGKRIVYTAGTTSSQLWAVHNLGLNQPDSP